MMTPAWEKNPARGFKSRAGRAEKGRETIITAGLRRPKMSTIEKPEGGQAEPEQRLKILALIDDAIARVRKSRGLDPCPPIHILVQAMGSEAQRERELMTLLMISAALGYVPDDVPMRDAKPAEHPRQAAARDAYMAHLKAAGKAMPKPDHDRQREIQAAKDAYRRLGKPATDETTPTRRPDLDTDSDRTPGP
jgi:hypothetical protein